MVYKSIELGKQYATKEEFLKDIKANKAKIISMKKSMVFKSIDKGQLSGNSVAILVATKGLSAKEDHFMPVINTTDFLDSHLDVHRKGIWAKTVKEQQGKIRYAMDHSNKIQDVVAWPEAVKMSTELVAWKDIGFSYEGKTEALIFDINKKDVDNMHAMKIIEKKRPINNSVSMQYVKIELAINDKDPEFSEEKHVWDKEYPSIVNKEKADESLIMWVVIEAKIVNESSMVTKGSNEATTTIYENDEPHMSTPHKQEAEKSHFDLSETIKNLNINL